MTVINLSPQNLKDVKSIFFHSFPKEEAPITYQLMSDLITTQTQPLCLNLGYKTDNRIVGSIGFSPVYFSKDINCSAYILSPLAVHENYQKRGIATALIESAKEQLRNQKVQAILVYGDPNYYSRFGFETKLGEKFIPPFRLTFPHGWQALMLNDEALNESEYHFTCIEALQKPEMW